MASMTALVSSAGRIFYIFDEGPTEAVVLPDKRMLIARDAFNGMILWKRPLTDWYTHLFPYKSGPAQLPRRLVAVDDTVFVTLGLRAPLTALDAASGETIRTFEETDATEEILHSDGVLFALVNRGPGDKPYAPNLDCMHEERNWVASNWTWNGRPREIMAIEADTGQTIWSASRTVVPLSLAADSEGVFFHDGKRIVRLDRASGDEVWKSEPVSIKSPIPSNFGPTLVVHQDVVLFSGGDRTMTALSAATGAILWTASHPPSGHHSPEDLLVSSGLVWAGNIAAGKGSGVFTGRDLHTGEVKCDFPPDVNTYWFHQRCYRSKATERFLLPSRTGIEFVDFETESWDIHHWVRGGCIYGIMPCNGLTYAPPHSCACYIDAKLNGFNALAPSSTSRNVPREIPDTDRLEKGPAYDTPLSAFRSPLLNDWPTYRHDPARTGRTDAALPPSLGRAWKTQIGGRLSSIVVAEGKLFVAQIDAHTVHALDADSGKARWQFTAGARVDSPPTIYRGRVLFGSADGYVYCLQADDGALIWRFRAAPRDDRLMAYEQLESVWPVHGSVLIHDDVLYCVAGRSMFLDGGMRLLKLDPVTGEKLADVVLDETDPETGESLQARLKGLNMPVALPDILSTDGNSLYMRTQRMDLDGKRLQIAPTEVTDQDGEGMHLFSGAGFLDDNWFHRAYWIYGKSIASGANGWFQAAWSAPAGRILVVGDETVYGFGRKPQYYRWVSPLEYHVFSVDKTPISLNFRTGEPEAPQYTEKCRIPNTRLRYRWSEDLPLLARAMVLAGETLFVAGPPDLLDEDEAYRFIGDGSREEQMRRQAASFRGQHGGLLRAIATTDGAKLAELTLDSPPVFDGMAAAGGGLFLATVDSSVVCLRARNQ
jgi:outer membrane protein assembly factor BamB